MLVSVIVVTYNSEDTVIETLDSVKNQSYDAIELIITDDASQDRTAELCEAWLKMNYSGFKIATLVRAERNSGVAANCNQGLKKAKGKWIKFCAGDDMLLSNCIADNVNHILFNPEIKVLFSYVDLYRNNFQKQNYLKTIPGNPYNPHGIFAENRESDSQFRMLLMSDRIHFTPSLFISKSALEEVGGFDERFPLFEDHPLWLKLTQKSLRLNFFEKVTVNYRMHEKSLVNTGKSYLIDPNYYLRENFRRTYINIYLPWDVRLNARYLWLVNGIFRLPLFMNRTKFNRVLHSLLSVYMNPFKYLLYITKRMNNDPGKEEFYS